MDPSGRTVFWFGAPRHRRRSLTVLAMVIAVLAHPLPAQSEDALFERETMPPLPLSAVAELSAVGWLASVDPDREGGCTGTLVRPDVVLTAAHCAGKMAPEGRVFQPGGPGSGRAPMAIAATLRHPAYDANGWHDPRFDVGLVFLVGPIPDVTPVTVSAEEPSGERVALAGFTARDKSTMDGNLACPIVERSERNLVLDCPVLSGNSGMPVLTHTPSGGWQMHGVVSSRIATGLRTSRALAARQQGWILSQLELHDAARRD